MNTYEIIGENQNGEAGSWEIKADDEKSLKKILIDRGIKAESINGETVKRARPALKEINEDAI